MPAPQQNAVPTYGNTSNIPRAQTYDQLHRASNKPGSALADLLGVLPGAVKASEQATKDAEPGPNENAQLMALAQIGAGRDRVRIARGQGFMGLLRGSETTIDAYNAERGRREADLAAGALRDAYATANLHHNSDPAAFQKFVQEQQQAIFANLKDADPSYYHGFVTRIGPVFEDMGKAHAGNLDGFLAGENKQAFEARLNTKMDIELQARAESDAFGIMMDTLMGGESGGNYNAFHGNGGNQAIRFTDMSIQEVLDWQKSGAYKQYGGGSSAVGKYQFINSTLAEVVRKSGIDPNTKFSPAVQDQLIMFRLLDMRGMQDFLDGNISAEQFLDNGLSYEFAGLKSTNGRGRYDDDGINAGNTSAAKSIAALNAYREAYVKDPRTFTDDKGRIDVASLGSPGDPNGIASMIDTVEEDFGVSQVEARDAAASQLVQKITSEPGFAERLDLPDLVRDMKLNEEQRTRVETARDQAIAEAEAQKVADGYREEIQFQTNTVDYILDGDASLLDSIGAVNPMLKTELIRRGDGDWVNPGSDQAAFVGGLDMTDPETIDDLIQGYVYGDIDRATFNSAMQTFQEQQRLAPVLNDPAVLQAVRFYSEQLPEKHRFTFGRLITDAVAELARQNGDQRPSLTAVLAAAGSVYQTQRSMIHADAERRAAKPEYQRADTDKNPPWMRVADGSLQPSPELLGRIRANPSAFPTVVEDIAAVSGLPEWRIESALWNPWRDPAQRPTDAWGIGIRAVGETGAAFVRGTGEAVATAMDKVGIGSGYPGSGSVIPGIDVTIPTELQEIMARPEYQ
ncbi:MAG: hypothetical protein ACO1O4_15995 [Devosia sp.]